MKKLLFNLLVVLLALPAVAQQMTDPPVIQVTESRNEYTINVTGNGLLTIELYRGGVDGFGEEPELFLTDQAYGNYQYVIPRPMDTSGSFTCSVKATAQEENMLPSHDAYDSFIVRGFFIMPTPVIMFNEVEAGLYIDVQGQGNLTVNVTINDESVDVDQLPFFVPRTYEDQNIYVNAVSDGYGNLDVLPAGATDSYVLTAAPVPPDPVVTPKPRFRVEEEEEYVIIYALPGDDPEGVFGEMAVYLYIQGQQVDNPCYVYRTDEMQDLDISAYAVSLSNQEALPSETAVLVYYIDPLEPPVPTLKTDAPTFVYGEIEGGGYGISIRPTEPSTIYFRMGAFSVEDGEFILGEWMEYGEELIIHEPGRYRVEAYALADGKLPSDWVAFECTVWDPTPSYVYDFEEDGIFYKITAEGKVSVCSETTDYNSYSGQVTIPATVTHDGVTYKVSGIQEDAFRGCVELTDVTIGAYVTTIGNRAFMSCISLTNVTLGDYVITLGSEAFSGCSNLASVTLGSGLAQIGANAFNGCDALASVTCKAATPPVMAASNCFDCYNTATLHVHPAVLDLYQAANYWNQFNSIVAEDKVAPAAGDANGDGKLTVSDVSALIDMLLSGE